MDWLLKTAGIWKIFSMSTIRVLDFKTYYIICYYVLLVLVMVFLVKVLKLGDR